MRGSIWVVVAKLILFAVLTLLATGMLAAVIGNWQLFTPFYQVEAEFTDATGLIDGDVVKIAGVDIGKIAGAEVETGREGGRAIARVTLDIHRDVTLPENVHAQIRFRNLIGQRMVVLSRDPTSSDVAPLPKDGSAVIPVAQTSPAVDLADVINYLQPTLRALDPEDANVLSDAIVQIFSGREARMREMIADLADLGDTLGDRGPIAADLVRDLNTVVGALAERDDELRSLLRSFDQLVGTLGDRSGELGRAVDTIGSASGDLANIIEGNRPELDQAIAQLRDILQIAAAHRDELDTTLGALPSTTHALNRAVTYGEWGNLNIVCLNGECAPGVEGSSVRGGGLADVFRVATGGGP